MDGEVFRGCGDAIIFLHRSDHLDAKPRRQIRVLTIDIFEATPALIARDVENRSVDVRVAQCSAFFGGDASYLANQFFVPHASLTDLRGKAGRRVSSEATNAFISEVNRNAEPRVFNEETLHFVHRPDMFPDVRGVYAF